MASSGVRGTTKNLEGATAPRSAGGRTAPRQRGPDADAAERPDPAGRPVPAKTAKAAPAKAAPAKAAPAKSAKAAPAKAAKPAPEKAAPAKSTRAKVTADGATPQTVPAVGAAPAKASTRAAPAKATATKIASTSAAGKTITGKTPAGSTTARKATTKRAAGHTGAAAASHASRRSSGTAAATGATGADLLVREDEAPWTPAELTEVRSGLESDVARLSSEIDVATIELQQLLRDSAEGTGDDQADAGAKTFEREQEISLANNSRGMLEQSMRALARLDDGSYGACESCGRPVGKMRLLAFPRATLCVSCKQQQERR
jgi:RNA polymerase-binding transcription factor DksA